jgi:hypothetical protein
VGKSKGILALTLWDHNLCYPGASWHAPLLDLSYQGECLGAVADTRHSAIPLERSNDQRPNGRFRSLGSPTRPREIHAICDEMATGPCNDTDCNGKLMGQKCVIFEAAGSGQRAGFGKRPVLLVVDVNYNFTGDRPEPILASIQRWPNSCGEDAWEALHHIKRLLQAARRKGIPVLYSTGGGRADGWDRGSWAWKNKRTSVGHPRHSLTPSRVDGNTINHEIAPLPQDIVIKQ